MHKESTIFTLRKPTKGRNPTTLSIEKFFCSTRDTPIPSSHQLGQLIFKISMVNPSQNLYVKPPNLIHYFTLLIYPRILALLQLLESHNFTHFQLPINFSLCNRDSPEKCELWREIILPCVKYKRERERERWILSFFSSSLSFLSFATMPKTIFLERVWIGALRRRLSYLYIVNSVGHIGVNLPNLTWREVNSTN